jgi:hypothetical protein
MNNNLESFRSPVAKFVLNTMNNSQQHKVNLIHSPTPKTQDSETIQSRNSESISPNSKQLLKLNNPPPSKFTIPSPHLRGIMLTGKSSKSTFKLRFDDLADMPEKDQDSEMTREEKIAFERSLIRKAHEEQRRKRIREK